MKILLVLLLGVSVLVAWSWSRGLGSSQEFQAPPALHAERSSESEAARVEPGALPAASGSSGGPGVAETRSAGGSSDEQQSPEIADKAPGGVPRPEPGSFDGKLIRDYFPSGSVLFEAQQRQRSDGSWELHGAWTAWHENGQMHERGAYFERQEHGVWEWWDPEGGQTAEGEFVRGKREGVWLYWYEDGTPMLEANYRDGLGEGNWTLYHANGRRKAQGNFVQGEITGAWTIWNQDGEVNGERTGDYEHGELVSH